MDFSRAAILKLKSLKINRFLPTDKRYVLLNFGVDIQKREPNNSKWPPGSRVNSGIAEKLYASTHTHR